MKILITGCNGQLGRELQRQLRQGKSDLGMIPSEYCNAIVDGVDLDQLDITMANSVDEWFREHGPYDLVINCAAFTNVDGCERDFPLAFNVNALGPMYLAHACRTFGSVLVHVSTDYVFPGTDRHPRIEGDLPAPISAYGRSKLAGEGLALAMNACTHIVRSAWLYGDGKNFVKTMLSLAKTNDSVTVVDDQFGNPTSTVDLASEILRLALTDEYGIWHCTCEGTCSWADFAEAIMEEFNTGCTVRRCTSEQWKELVPTAADRPKYSSLENGKLRCTIGSKARLWRDALAAYRKSIPISDQR